MDSRYLVAGVVILGGAYALSLYSKGSAIENLRFNIANVKLSFQGLTPVMDVTVRIGNTSNQSFQVRAIGGTLYVNGYQAGTVESYQTVNILPTTQADVKVQVRLSLVGIGKQIVDIIQGKQAVAAVIRFVGAVNVEALQFPLDITYNIV